MSETRIQPVYGRTPPCYLVSRLEERRNRQKALRMDQHRRQDRPEDFITYTDSDNEDESDVSQQNVLRTSYSIVEYAKSREVRHRYNGSVINEYGSRHMLTHEMFRESPINLGHVNKVFCSVWLTDRQVVLGTKCNKLMVYDVITNKLDTIPLLLSRRTIDVPNSGIHSVQVNPSRTLLATGARNACDIAIYSLPTLDPVCVGENANKDWVFDMCWIDDEYIISASRDSKMALWRISPDIYQYYNEIPTYQHISAISVKNCLHSQKVRALTFNKLRKEVAAISLNGYVHVWDVARFTQCYSKKLPSFQENVCISSSEDCNLYAVGCRSYTLLLDTRTIQTVKKVSSRYSGCGIRSSSFQGSILTIGTGLGMLMFYDLRARKYLESSINSSRTVLLKASMGYVFPDAEFVDSIQNGKYVPAIYTHCYDVSGTRLFTAGGPLPASLTGNYAALWH